MSTTPVPARLSVSWSHKTIMVMGALLLIVCGIGAAGAFVWAQQYEGRIAPHVAIGTVDVSGLDPETARVKLRDASDQFLAAGIPVIFGGTQATLALATSPGSSGSDATELVEFAIDEAVRTAMQTDRAKNPALDTLLLIKRQFARSAKHVNLPVQTNEAALTTVVRTLFPNVEAERRDAGFTITRGTSGWNVTLLAGRPGRVFDTNTFFEELTHRLEVLNTKDAVTLTLKVSDPSVTDADAESLIPSVERTLRRSPFTIAERPDGSGRSWVIRTQDMANLLEPDAASNPLALGIKQEAWETFLNEHIAPDVEVAAQNARFRIEQNRVIEFAKSKTGISIEKEAMREALSDLMNEGTETILVLETQTTEPEVTTEQGNDLGVTDLLGSGYSSYKGSPANRVKNIANGVRLLNGLLIPPETTFSLIDALKPFTIENGYLPELVIKGDKIEPELGGGLCQIGTTTFRTAMNSGLPIAERRNHSLVVSYYNDPGNGNPGTDATIYEPAPDLKFTNDTGHYVLFMTHNDTKTQELTFEFWGTNDGRKGSYTPPEVLRWIPVGETQRIESPTLKPGEETCQSAHVGADTRFTYTILRADGTEEKTVFDSHYRPLPKICLVGAPVETESLEPSAEPISGNE